ncbi:MAG: cytochrome b/b6 domain-containing protein [Rhodopila sp.]|nr:cytochrome b/b6 domain-containing protein [Rhodopila sp.]
MIGVRRRFTALQRMLHWLMAVCILAMLSIGVGMVSTVMPKYLTLVSIHKPLGIAILVLAVVRLVVRLRYRAPSLPVGRAYGVAAWHRCRVTRRMATRNSVIRGPLVWPCVRLALFRDDAAHREKPIARSWGYYSRHEVTRLLTGQRRRGPHRSSLVFRRGRQAPQHVEAHGAGGTVVHARRPAALPALDAAPCAADQGA